MYRDMFKRWDIYLRRIDAGVRQRTGGSWFVRSLRLFLVYAE